MSRLSESERLATALVGTLTDALPVVEAVASSQEVAMGTRITDSADAHEQLQRVTGAAGLSGVLTQISSMSEAAYALLDLLDELEDDDGRQVWMVDGEVELDQWVEKVARARDELRRVLR